MIIAPFGFPVVPEVHIINATSDKSSRSSKSSSKWTIPSSVMTCDRCQQHSFFQLSPFLTNNISKICMRVSEDTLEELEYSFDYLTKNLEEQKDWYWSCRARSFFIDIINILERIYHNFYIDEPYDVCIKVAISSEFKSLLSYINNHLEEKQTLGSLYSRFRINKNQIEKLFKEFLNTTFYEYLRNRRFEEATYYL
ncbi:MAG: helix-turn-helix transcriptional regulator, partial [Clostridia bacterium]|nr:helix-turn-helix transcriptional regulator [Clostridia bacterium]